MITRDQIETYAMGLPAVTKVVQWGGSDVYKVGGKVFAVVGFENGVAFKVSEIGFEVLTSDGGPGRQAPYFAKGGWVVVDLDAADLDEATGWLEAAHGLIAGKLTKKARAELGL
jgi:predicted DNA-binding protein (MmcQ/YjbR family)